MMLGLACYFPAEKPHFLSVKVDPDAFVHQLTKKIHENLELYGIKMQLDDLYLYKTDVQFEPDDDLPRRSLQWIYEQPDEARLAPKERLSKVFPDGKVDMYGEALQIMVADRFLLQFKDPADAEHARKVDRERAKRIAGLLSFPAPSHLVISPKRRETICGEQLILDHVPVAIFSPPLAKLQQRLEHLDDIPVAPAHMRTAIDFSSKALDMGDINKAGAWWLRPEIDRLVGPGVWDQNVEWADVRPGAVWWRNGFPAMLLEVKSIKGLGGDAILQAAAGSFPIPRDVRFWAQDRI